ncbi:2-hydroxyacid dehydrogenase [Sphingomonadales bacterium 56]|uniref:2-hydroxyacid dehydrogenase n=1 Tax=unclassified Sphingobium TaxID=2611147 RepID=UPI00191A5EDF|nr:MULTISPECIES: 2-hydroxyacid dehydrogenase [unclassified Sphingobium]MBY2929611.1 2-hydroxyacid dehydrogenase [Sphingomonadales bacterium 56]MBY2958547.1 2-hydroxyacid dehydrogenase [Sphingomonadales bacterium 58]CAD7337298.1 2-ketogluconate reductase [Sphingobium sp. S8]CAD7339706.1 2-ketogluconate reductase [Sphingobium sp. S6]
MSQTRIPIVAYGPLSPYLEEQLKARFQVHEVAADADPTALDDAVREARALVSFGSVGASAAIMDALPRLEMISLFSVGYDKVDVAHARKKGIKVSNTPDVLTDDVADLAVGLLYAAVRNIAASDRMVRSGKWALGQQVALSGSVTGSRIGILGLGRIGRAIARRLEPVASEIIYHNRMPAAGTPYRYVQDRIAFARESEVIIVATSGGPEARGLVDAAMLDALGPQGMLINISRGSVVDEDALVAALAEGRIGGAGLDVFVNEPQVPEALFTLDNVVLQPHQGSATINTRKAMADLVLANLDAWAAGKALVTPVI